MDKEITQQTIAFIGAGNMANAIISGLIAANWPSEHLIAVNRSAEKNQALAKSLGISANSNAVEAANKAQIVVLGVKPQNMAELLASMSHVDWQHKLVISLAAGITLARLNEMANAPLNAIRAMPNTPALVAAGVTGLYAPASITSKQKQMAERLMQAVGKVSWLAHEDEINTVIAAAGSAPAYFFLFMQAMQVEAKRQGLSQEQAKMLVQQAALGAAKLATEHNALSFVELKDQVTSKGGTTFAALKVFDDANLSAIVAKAMQAAVTRAKEMESLF